MTTPRRFHRLRRVLERRQPDLTVLLENVHKPHNFAAILRTADAVGLFEAHAVVADLELRTSLVSASGSEKWVEVKLHPTVIEASRVLRSQGLRLFGAHLASHAVDYRKVDFTQPCAIFFGQEKDGLTAEALALVDELIAIPMAGLVASLNVSVAAAVVLFEAHRQRQAAGFFDRPRLSSEILERTLFEWTYPELAAKLTQEGRPYPPLGPDGELARISS